MIKLNGYEKIPRRAGVGRIYNSINEKSFILFSSTDLKERIRTTVCALERKELHSSIQTEWNSEIFECEILELTEDRNQYYFWIKEFDTFNSGFNITNIKRQIPNSSGVYALHNTNKNRMYIGWSNSNMRQRVTQHVSNLERGIEGNFSLQRDWNSDSSYFRFLCLEETDLEEREIYWILKLRSISTGYNLKLGNIYYCYLDLIEMEEKVNEDISCTDRSLSNPLYE